MQNSGTLTKNTSLKVTTQQSLRRLGLCSQISTGQQSSPIVFPEKRSRRKSLIKGDLKISNKNDPEKAKRVEHKIDIVDEQSDLLGYEVFTGKLVLDKKKTSKSSETQGVSDIKSQNSVDSKLTSKALLYGSHILYLEDVVSVSYCFGLRHFTIHAYPYKNGFSCFSKPVRGKKDYFFFALNPEEAIQWVSSFADQQCYVNFLPHPINSSKKSSEFASEVPPEVYIRVKSPPRVLIILNPRSGHGRSIKVFHGMVEPIFKLAGFDMEVVKTTSAGHARKLASSVELSSCPDGIICVGGDGIVNEVLNGLLSRDNQKEAINMPIGIIPAGSDNSLVFTVLGVKDPISAALAIVKGGLTATDVFAVEWIQSGAIHFGMTCTYFGFVSDVLELSAKHQKRFGPLRYLVAGFLKFLCLPKYTFELEYLPVTTTKDNNTLNKISKDEGIIDISGLYTTKPSPHSGGLPRPSSLSSIDSIMSPSQHDIIDTSSSTTEPSDYVRAIDSKSKRLSSNNKNNLSNEEPEVIIHPQSQQNWSRTKSKSRITGLTVSKDTSSKGYFHDKEDNFSTMSDPGPIWDSEPRWDSEPNWNEENRIDLPGSDDLEEVVKKTDLPLVNEEGKWVKKKGNYLAVLVCNHECRSVQSKGQIVAPKAEFDDKEMDLLLVHGNGRFRLLRFFVLLQLGRHLSLPYVEYVKVKSVKIKAGKQTHNGCGIDGELFQVNGQVVSSLLPEQCQLLGRAPRTNK